MLPRPTMSGDPSKNLTMSQSSNSNEENACQRLQFGVVQFPGSNSDQDCIHAVESMGHEARYIWHKDTDLGGVHAVLVPGGFSYGDYLRAGAIARLSPVMHAVAQFAEAGGLVMGICNGFQILCEAGLLPGALIRNRSLQFRSEFVHLKVLHEDEQTQQIVPPDFVRNMWQVHRADFVRYEMDMWTCFGLGTFLWFDDPMLAEHSTVAERIEQTNAAVLAVYGPGGYDDDI